MFARVCARVRVCECARVRVCACARVRVCAPRKSTRASEMHGSVCGRRVGNLEAFDGRCKACGHQELPGGQEVRGERPAQARGRAGGAESGRAGAEEQQSRARGGRQSLQSFARLSGSGATASWQTLARAGTRWHARGCALPHRVNAMLQLVASGFLSSFLVCTKTVFKIKLLHGFRGSRNPLF